MVNVPQRYIPKHLSKTDKNKLKKELLKSRKMYKKGKYHTRKKVKSFSISSFKVCYDRIHSI